MKDTQILLATLILIGVFTTSLYLAFLLGRRHERIERKTEYYQTLLAEQRLNGLHRVCRPVPTSPTPPPTHLSKESKTMTEYTTEALLTVANAIDMNPRELAEAAEGTAKLLRVCHTLALKGGWWNDPKTGEPLERNKGEMLMLIVSEVSEAMEGERKNCMDDKLPHRKMAEVELADAIIREGDYAGGHGYDVVDAMIEKMAYNLVREDHKIENRLKEEGKAW